MFHIVTMEYFRHLKIEILALHVTNNLKFVACPKYLTSLATKGFRFDFWMTYL